MILNGHDFGRTRNCIVILKAQSDRLRRRIRDQRQAVSIQAEINRIEERIGELSEQMRTYSSSLGVMNSTPEIVPLIDVPVRLIQRRLRLGLTQSDLGNAAGQTRQCISRYERTRYAGASLARLIQIDSLLRAEEVRRLSADSHQMVISL